VTNNQRFAPEAAAAMARCSVLTQARATVTGELTSTKEHGRVLIERAGLDCWIRARQARQRPNIRAREAEDSPSAERPAPDSTEGMVYVRVAEAERLRGISLQIDFGRPESIAPGGQP